jgi:hypothetical protein
MTSDSSLANGPPAMHLAESTAPKASPPQRTCKMIRISYVDALYKIKPPQREGFGISQQTRAPSGSEGKKEPRRKVGFF